MNKELRKLLEEWRESQKNSLGSTDVNSDGLTLYEYFKKNPKRFKEYLKEKEKKK